MRATRVLIYSADIGEGHDLPARTLRDAITARRPESEVEIVDVFSDVSPLVRALVRDNTESVLARLPWLYDIQYWLVARFPPVRFLARRIGWALTAKRLIRRARARHPDVIVATYPGANELLCEARRRGLLEMPVVSAITDLAALDYWAHPGCDMHLTIHPESSEEIRAIAGPGARIEPVRDLTSARFNEPAERTAARRSLSLDPDAPLVVVSGGGWGMGDLEGAIDAALASGPQTHVLALCGRNDELRTRLEARFAGEPRVSAIGFTDRMSDVLAAADVLVHSTAGLTVFEALLRGCRVISYGWGVGHIRINNRAYRRFGLADVAASAGELVPALRRALTSPGRPDEQYSSRRSAADPVLELAAGLESADRA